MTPHAITTTTQTTIRVVTWNAQTLTTRKLGPIRTGLATGNTIIVVTEYKASFYLTQHLTSIGGVAQSQSGDIMILTPADLTTIVEVDWGWALRVSVRKAKFPPVWITAVHLSNDAKRNAEQMQELRSFNWETSEILLGDFNTPPTKAFEDKGMKYAGERTPTHYASQSQEPQEGYTHRCIDHIYTNKLDGGMIFTWDPISTRLLSDHKMISIEIPWMEGGNSDSWRGVSRRRKKINPAWIDAHPPTTCNPEGWEGYINRVADNYTPPVREPGWDTFLDILIPTYKTQPHIAEMMAKEACEARGEEWSTTREKVMGWVTQRALNKTESSSFHYLPRRLQAAAVASAIFRPISRTSGIRSLEVDGTVITDPGEIMLQLRDMAERAFERGHPPTWDHDNFTDQPLRTTVEGIEQITIEDITAEMGILQRKYTKGADGWDSKAVSLTSHTVRNTIALNIQQWIIWVGKKGEFGGGEGASCITPIAKKTGAIKSWDQIRPIESDNYNLKLACRLIHKKIKPISGQLKCQFGFVPGRGGHPAWSIVNNLVSQGEMIVLLDITGAYTSVDNPLLTNIIEKKSELSVGVKGFLKALLKPRQCFLVREGRMAKRPFVAFRGLRQGNPLSPLLFNIYLAPIISCLQTKYKGAVVFYVFADDIAIWLKSKTIDVEKLIRDVMAELASVNLIVNPHKTKMFTDGRPIPQNWIHTLTKSDKYLGLTIPQPPPSIEAPDFATRLEKSKQTVGMTLRQHLPMSCHVVIFNVFIWSKFIYLFQHVPPSQEQLDMIWKVIKPLFGIYTRTGAYLGRSLENLVKPKNLGGMGLTDYKSHAQGLKAILIRYNLGLQYWPQQDKREAEILIQIVSTAKAMTPHTLIEQIWGGKHTTTKAITNAIGKGLVILSAEELKWKKNWGSLQKLSDTTRDFWWKATFKILPSPEAWTRHFDVATMTKCVWCHNNVVQGWTHWLCCKEFWSGVTWIHKNTIAPLPAADLLHRSREVLSELTELWRRFMSAPANPWFRAVEEFVAESEDRKKRTKRPTASNTQEYLDIANTLSKTPATLGYDFSNNINGANHHRELILHVPKPRSQKYSLPVKTYKFYTDGSEDSGTAGWGLCSLELGIRAQGEVIGEQTNNRAELTAIAVALGIAGAWGLGKFEVHSDSQYAIGAIQKTIKTTANQDLLTFAYHTAAEFKINTRECVKWIKAHSGMIGNEIADTLAKQAVANIKKVMRLMPNTAQIPGGDLPHAERPTGGRLTRELPTSDNQTNTKAVEGSSTPVGTLQHTSESHSTGNNRRRQDTSDTHNIPTNMHNTRYAQQTTARRDAPKSDEPPTPCTPRAVGQPRPTIPVRIAQSTEPTPLTMNFSVPPNINQSPPHCPPPNTEHTHISMTDTDRQTYDPAQRNWNIGSRHAYNPEVDGYEYDPALDGWDSKRNSEEPGSPPAQEKYIITKW